MPVLTTSERICLFYSTLLPNSPYSCKMGRNGEKKEAMPVGAGLSPHPHRTAAASGTAPSDTPARSPRSRLGPNGTGQTHSKHLSSSSSVLTPDLLPRSWPRPCRHHTAGAIPSREARQGPEQGQEHPGHRGRAPQPPLGPGGLLGLQPHTLCPQVGTVTPRAFQQYEPLRAFLCCCGPDRGSQPSL